MTAQRVGDRPPRACALDRRDVDAYLEVASPEIELINPGRLLAFFVLSTRAG